MDLWASRDDALLLTHALPTHDDGEMERYVEAALETFPGTTVLVSQGYPTETPYGGADAYDLVVMDHGRRGTPAPAARDRDLLDGADRYFVGGGRFRRCMAHTYAWADELAGDDGVAAVVADVAFGQDRPGGALYRLADRDDELAHGLSTPPYSAYDVAVARMDDVVGARAWREALHTTPDTFNGRASTD